MGKATPTDAALWSRAKSAAKKKFKVYPSAYANAWAAKWYKEKGGGWRGGNNKVRIASCQLITGRVELGIVKIGAKTGGEYPRPSERSFIT